MISLIAAIGTNNELGANNRLLWSMPNDLKRFKNITMGYMIVMGRKTYESIGRPLPNRKNIVISSLDSNYFPEEVEVITSIHSLLLKEKEDKKHYFVIGGEQIYNEFLPIADRLYLTRVDGNFPEADCFFPEINDCWEEWHTPSIYKKDDRHDYDYSFHTYKRVRP